MPSLDDLKKQSLVNKKEQEVKASEEIIKQKAEKNKLYDRKKLQHENFVELNKENADKLDKEKGLRYKSVTAFRKAMQELREQFAQVKKDPNSIFAPFFEKDTEGKPVARLNYENIFDNENGIQDFREAEQELEQDKPKIKELRNTKNKLKQVLDKSEADLKELYKDTEEYREAVATQEKTDLIKEYFRPNLKQLVMDSYYELRKDRYIDRLTPVFKLEVRSIVLDHKEEDTKALRDILNQSLDQELNSLDKKQELDKLSQNVKTIEKFNQERHKTLESIRIFKKEAKDFSEVMIQDDNFRAFFGSKENILYGIEQRLGFFGLSLEDIKDALMRPSQAFNQVINLELLEREMIERSNWMKDIFKLKNSNENFSGKVENYHKELLNLDEKVKKDLGLDTNQRYYFETLDISQFKSLAETKNHIQSNEKITSEVKDLLSKYYNLELTLELKFADIIKLKDKLLDREYEPNRGNYEYLDKTKQEVAEFEVSLQYLNLELSSLDKYIKYFASQNKLAEKIIPVYLTNVGTRLENQLASFIDSIKVIETDSQKIKAELSQAETDLKDLENEKVGLLKKKKHEQSLVDKRDQISNLKLKQANLEKESRDKINFQKSTQDSIYLRELMGEGEEFKTKAVKELVQEILNTYSKTTIESLIEEIKLKAKQVRDNLIFKLEEYKPLQLAIEEYAQDTERKAEDFKKLKILMQDLPTKNIFLKKDY